MGTDVGAGVSGIGRGDADMFWRLLVGVVYVVGVRGRENAAGVLGVASGEAGCVLLLVGVLANSQQAGGCIGVAGRVRRAVGEVVDSGDAEVVVVVASRYSGGSGGSLGVVSPK